MLKNYLRGGRQRTFLRLCWLLVVVVGLHSETLPESFFSGKFQDFSKYKMSDDEGSSLQAKHRRERKELQAKIQAMKKTASKGDKKKKKEVLEEIAQLEADLDRRQEEEQSLEETTNDVKQLDISSVEQEAQEGQRVSKAQKRRDKKANEERDRQAEILAQELLNVHGPRQQESDSIKALLKTRHLILNQIPSDGDCLYNAVRHQLTLLQKPPLSIAELRALTADYILANREDLIHFMTNAEGDCLSEQEFLDYVENVRNTRAWGGQIEIQALSNSLRCPIDVIQATGSIVQGVEKFKGKPLVLTYHRHMYSLGEHYNSARPQAGNEDAEEGKE